MYSCFSISCEQRFDTYLKLIQENSICEHKYIKFLVAYGFLETGNKTQIWIAKDVIKELERVVKTEGQKRLISANSNMGKER